MRGLVSLVIFALTLALASCGSNAGESVVGGAGDPPASPADTRGFALNVLPETYDYTAQANFALSAARVLPDGGIALDITYSGASALKALYCAVDYDASRWHPVGAEADAGFGRDIGAGGAAGTGCGEEALSLGVFSEPGKLHWGQSLVHPAEQAGVSGSGTLAHLRFAPGKAQAVQKAASKTMPFDNIPFGVWNANTVVWKYVFLGDYDQNGEVNISDIAPLASNLGQVLPGSGLGSNILPVGLASVCDGDLNDEINLSDLTPIAANFQRSASGYELYSSTDPADCPVTPNVPPGPGAQLVAQYSINDGRRVFADQGINDPERSQAHYIVPADFDHSSTYYWVKMLASDPADAQISLPTTDSAAGPPTSQRSQSIVFVPAGRVAVAWDYRNPGDYNQDGQVLIGDFEFVQSYMGSSHPGWPSICEVVDGDENFEVNVSDLTPTLLFLHTQVEGYHVYASDDRANYPDGLPGTGDVELIGDVPFSAAIGDPTEVRLSFEFALNPWPGAGAQKRYLWVKPYTWAGEEGIASNIVDWI